MLHLHKETIRRMADYKRCTLRALPDIINPYAWVIKARNMAFDNGILETRVFKTPTICIGNISVGGTGKTPHTEYLIRLLKDRFRTAMLSRGYGRKSKGYIKASASSPMQQIGDEPFQIKNKFPDIDVAVCEKRVVGIERLMTEIPDIQVLLLDDAYQHRYVKAGLNILLIDSKRPVWNDNILPFGRLRESISGIRRADIAIMTKCNGMTEEEAERCRRHITCIKDIPVFFSTMRYGALYGIFGQECNVKIGEGTNVLLVTGIAKPGPLKAEIERRGARVTLMRYADHHNFTTAELEKIASRFKTMGSAGSIIVTTEKDATRLIQRNDLPPSIREKTFALPIEVEILHGKENMFNQIIEDYVTENSGNS